MIYDYEIETINGEHTNLQAFVGDVLLIVNTASNCGFTPQYKELQQLYDEFHSRGFHVLGFPCNQFGAQEPGENEEILTFCERNYGVSFPVFSKVEVKGKNAHPLFRILTENALGVLGTKAIKWNFTKFLINREGKVVQRYGPTTTPSLIKSDIEKLM